MPRWLYVIFGWFFFALGMVGVALPILPTVPFLILAAACFSRGSERAYRWLLKLPGYGQAIHHWREHRTIPLKTKILATLMLWVTLGTSIVFFVPMLVGKIVMAGIGAGVTIFIWTQGH